MNLGKLLSNFAKHYKPGHGGFSLNKPVNSNGVTEQSFAGVQVPMQNPAGSQMIKNADPQTAYRGRMNAVEGNPLNFVGDLGTKLLGGQNGRVELSGGHEPLHEINPVDQIKQYPDKGQGFDGAYPTEMSGEPQTAPGDYRPMLANDFMMGVDDPIRVGDGLNAGVKPKSKLGEKLSKTKSEINRREGKDFSKKVNPETGEITYGADYDKDHDWKDSLRSAGLGILQSLAQANPNESLGTMLGRGLGGGISGGVAGALDRNADEKLGNKIALGNLYQDYAKQLGVQDAELGIAKKKKDIENIDVDNDRLKQKAEDDVELRTVEQQIRRDRLTFDKEKAAELAQLRRDQLEYRKEGDTKRYAQTQARIDELTRHNKVMEGQGERKTQAIESRAKMAADKAKTSIPAQSKRKGVLTDAQIIKIATGIDDDFNNGRIDEATYNARINLMLEGINGRNK